MADTVFVGTLRTVITDDLPVFGSDDPARFVFAVSEVYKGEVFERQSVVTPRSGASCGLEVSGSGSIVVFARSARLAIGEPDGLIPADELASGEVSSHLCSGTRMIGSNPLPARFGEPQAPLPGSSGVGGGASATAVVVIGGIAIGVVAVAGAGLVIGRRRAAR